MAPLALARRGLVRCMATDTTQRDLNIFKDKALSAEAARQQLADLGDLTEDRCLTIARELIVVKEVKRTPSGR